MMTLKELLKLDFGVDLPISGGYGNSIEESIIIHRTEINDYVGTEKVILNCLGKGRNIEWRFLGQELLDHNDKNIDKITIGTKQTTKCEIITQKENYYFDISDCFGEMREESPFDEKDTLEKIKKRLIELERLNDFNKKCIDLFKKEALSEDLEVQSNPFIDALMKGDSLEDALDLSEKDERWVEETDLRIDFMEMLMKDKSYPLFKSMMDYRKKPMMDVLSIVAKELNENHDV